MNGANVTINARKKYCLSVGAESRTGTVSGRETGSIYFPTFFKLKPSITPLKLTISLHSVTFIHPEYPVECRATDGVLETSTIRKLLHSLLSRILLLSLLLQRSTDRRYVDQEVSRDLSNFFESNSRERKKRCKFFPLINGI